MIQTPSFPISAQTRVAEGGRARSPLWQQCIQLIGHSLRRMGASLLRLRVVWGTPAFFQFERQGPVQRRLGPGLSRDPDGFWPVSEWWI
jgi:hypothetical protein